MILIVPSIFIIFTIGLIIILKFMKGREIEVSYWIYLMLGIVILVGGCFLNINKNKYDVLYKGNEAGYTVFLDGVEVNEDTVSFQQYYIEIDDKNECILLSQKRTRPSIPVVVIQK